MASFRENDIELLQSGNFADGTVKCKGRTWKVHRMLLASRLKFFKAAFYGSFAEATSGEVSFPEHDPESVNLMLRHLYSEDLDAEQLETPALCVRCWRLADYTQLESLKTVAMSALGQHLDTMAWLACGNWNRDNGVLPRFLTHLFFALREVCLDEATEPLHAIFATFLWVTRFELLVLHQTLDCLTECHGLNQKLMKLLVLNGFDNDADWPAWIPDSLFIRQAIQDRDRITHHAQFKCAECKYTIKTKDVIAFYNPFPVGILGIGKVRWCEGCFWTLITQRHCSWRSSEGGQKTGFMDKPSAWSL